MALDCGGAAVQPAVSRFWLHCCRQSEPKENSAQSEAPGGLSSRGKGLLGAFGSSYYVSIAATPMPMFVCTTWCGDRGLKLFHVPGIQLKSMCAAHAVRRRWQGGCRRSLVSKDKLCAARHYCQTTRMQHASADWLQPCTSPLIIPRCRTKDNPDGYTVLAVAENRQSIDLMQVDNRLTAVVASAVVCQLPVIQCW